MYNYYDNLEEIEQLSKQDFQTAWYKSIWYVKGSHSIDFKYKESMNSTTRYYLQFNNFENERAFLYHLCGRFGYSDYIKVKTFVLAGDFSESVRIV